MKRFLLTVINKLGGLLPKPVQRFIADFPGVLSLMQKIGGGARTAVTTPEGWQLVINPLFHANLQDGDGLADYEPELRKAIARLTRRGYCAYDIGANVGVFSLQFSAIVEDQGMVYAFEPETNNIDCLGKTISLNRLRNIRFDKRAIGDAQGSALFDRRGGVFSGRLVNDKGNHKPTKNLMSVETVSIDSLIEQEGFRPPDIVKIDVEGNEGMVLAGMERTLARHHPAIICELHGHLGDSVEDVFRQLRANDYQVFAIADFNKSGTTARALSAAGRHRHVVAIAV